VNPEPGWYPDPFDSSQDRWWNGSAWTENTQAGPQTPDPYAAVRATPTPEGGDYVAGLTDDGSDLPDYEVLASVEEGAKENSYGDSVFEPAPNTVSEWGEEYPDGTSASRGKSNPLIKIALIASLLVVLLGGLGSAAVFLLFGGNGPQVEDILPENTALMARIDLDPSLEQKVNIIRLLSRFPDLSVSPEDGRPPQDALLDAIAEDVDTASASTVKEAKNWVGSRFGVGLVPTGTSEYSPVAIVAVKDAAALDTFMEQYASEYYYTVRDDYAIISDSQKVLEQVISSERSLSENSKFASAQSRLALDAIGLLWVDASQLKGLRNIAQQGSILPLPVDENVNAAGSILLGIAAEPDALRIAAATESLIFSDVPSLDLSTDSDGIQSLPANTSAAFSLGAPNIIVRDLISYLEKTSPEALEQLDGILAEAETDRDGLISLLGTHLTLVSFSDGDSPLLALAVKDQGLSPKEIKKILTAIGGISGLAVDSDVSVIEAGENSYLVPAQDEARLNALLQESPTSLSETEPFRRAFPNGSQGVLAIFMSEKFYEDVSEMSENNFLTNLFSVGLTVRVDPEAPGNSRTEIVIAFR